MHRVAIADALQNFKKRHMNGVSSRAPAVPNFFIPWSMGFSQIDVQ